ncbi:hypothetical protein B5E41_29125 [Rhizobium esperanzae]|uniref:Uncharacterized protein n=1 Tax=Rhizobium esperanzae TaxID=1967781 RepID=A0A246DLC3_9HYPH|nr:hypothetical protein [Rhizobium esperanzae]OWO89991.1 hypothetical protein B5E41_29125 [Rhizobium esperanzae]
MRAEIETTSYFKQVASALDLTRDETALAWDMMTKANVGRDDPVSVMFCVLAKTGGMTSGVSDDLKHQVEELMSNLRAGVSSDIEAGMSKALAAMPADLISKVEGALEKSLGDLVRNVDMLVTKEAAKRETFRLSKIATSVAAISLLCLAVGYVVGRDSVTATAARFENLMARPDASAALKVFANNDMNRVLAECGGVGTTEFRGAPACKPTIAVGPSLNSVEGVNGVKLIWTQLVVKIGSWGLLAAGLVTGVGLGRWWGSRKRVAA